MNDNRMELRAASSRIDHLFDLGKKEEGKALILAALAASTADEPYHFFFQGEAAWYLDRDGRKQKECLLRAYQLAEDDPHIVKNLGVYFLLNCAERKAIRLFEKVLALDPADWEAARYKGLALSNLGRERKAMEWYATAITLNPSDYDAMRQTGVSLSKLGKDAEAIEWYRRALAVNAEDYDSLRQMGISLAMLERYDMAVQCLNLALAVHPNDFETQRNLRLVTRKMTGEGENFLSRLINSLGRRLAYAWRRLLNRLW